MPRRTGMAAPHTNPLLPSLFSLWQVGSACPITLSELGLKTTMASRRTAFLCLWLFEKGEEKNLHDEDIPLFNGADLLMTALCFFSRSFPFPPIIGSNGAWGGDESWAFCGGLQCARTECLDRVLVPLPFYREREGGRGRGRGRWKVGLRLEELLTHLQEGRCWFDSCIKWVMKSLCVCLCVCVSDAWSRYFLTRILL